MNLQMGNQTFVNVDVPLLWGDRAVIQDEKGHLSVIDLSCERGRIEVLADEPAPGVSFYPRVDGIVILQNGTELYNYNPQEKTLSSISLDLPEVQISPSGTRVGSSQFTGNIVSGRPVGIAVRKDGIAFGSTLPAGLAKLMI
jgi:hypothetical protein